MQGKQLAWLMAVPPSSHPSQHTLLIHLNSASSSSSSSSATADAAVALALLFFFFSPSPSGFKQKQVCVQACVGAVAGDDTEV